MLLGPMVEPKLPRALHEHAFVSVLRDAAGRHVLAVHSVRPAGPIM